MPLEIAQTFKELGFSHNQAKVLSALFELKEATVHEVAEKAGLKRTSIYAILEELKRWGFIYEAKVKKHTYYVAEDPLKVIDDFRLKVEKLSFNLREIQKTTSPIHKARVLVFGSSDGFKRIWQVIFNSGLKEYCIITDGEVMLEFVKKRYILNRIIKEKVRRGIKSRQLIINSPYGREIMKKDVLEGRVSKVLPGIFKLPFTKIIFGNRVALISPYRENIILILESESFAKSEQALFEELWNSVP